MLLEHVNRFCSKDYEPFNANDVDSYVVGDDYTPTWKVNITIIPLADK